MSRYSPSDLSALSSNDERYDYLFENRDAKIVYMLAMAQMSALSDKDRKSLNTRRYTWRSGDQYWKVAQKFYGDERLWFIIAYFNKAPTDFHMQAGRDILVPVSPQLVLERLGM
jgi:nucleoid-associated protein YgaU|tara:strand:+ start:1985 stop:2326 length:342 start_codon:yes stop_codon:yes gene_type:complete